MEVPKSLMTKKSKEDEQTLADLSSAHHCSQAKCQLVQTSYIKRIVCHVINILYKPSCVYTPHCVQSVLIDQDSPIQTSCSVNKSYIVRNDSWPTSIELLERGYGFP